ncbi:hypothetical protein BKK79_31340 [Cupriavidus sp. USMAA2-4]|uniref:hypothetical protein n=1 Tax=Cupriavidus sp. USMAA2-4 TaxID=876364 RepID=UPI0008A6C90B|nr:hypothetical protein [Cupriavidus sp. USMAA2-4]AOY96130.1 hypothetical protein BKK79_31340 [Cupriavidus sp. USMAA2-4]
MPIWRVSPVEDEPEIALRLWRVFETERGERHFIGQNIDSRTGRVSSAIHSFDPQSRTGVTRSGRRYVLVGGPGDDEDATHTWTLWKLVNDVRTANNVTAEYEDLLGERAT